MPDLRSEGQLNSCNFVGRVGKDVRFFQTYDPEITRVEFSICCWGEKSKPTWVKCKFSESKTWPDERTAFITSGRMIAVSGSISVEAWLSADSTANAALVCSVKVWSFCDGVKAKPKA